jgi:uncharacterized protein YgiB involved in biofilm formation
MRTLLASSAVAAALFLAPSIALAQAGGTGAFCLKKASDTQATNCGFQTMAQCEQSKTDTNDICAPRSQTTGEGPTTGAPKGMKK